MFLSNLLLNGTLQPFGTPNYGPFFFKANGRLFIGGENTDTIFGVPVNGVSEWRGGTLHQLKGNPFTQPQDMWGAAYWNGKYYFHGATTGELGSPAIVAYDGDSTWNGVANGIQNGWVRGVAGLGDSLYVGGWFLQAQNNQSDFVQIYDGTQWKPFFPEVQFFSQVWDIQTYNGAVYISGLHHWVGDTTWYGILRYDGNELCSIGGPMPAGDNGKMAFFQGDLYMALATSFPGLEWEFVGRLPLDGLVPDTCITVVNTGVSERAEEALGLYPNPGREQLSLSAPADTWPAEVEVRDMAGRLVHRERLAASTALYTGTWAAGTYTVQLRHRDGTVDRGTWVRLP